MCSLIPRVCCRIANSAKFATKSLEITASFRFFSKSINFKVTTRHNLTFSNDKFPKFSSQESISSLQVKKRPIRKRKVFEGELERPAGIFSVAAFATAEEYDLENLTKGLSEQDLYAPKSIENAPDVVHAIAKYQVEEEPREIFFFRDGGVVLWNITDLESGNVLNFLRRYERESYPDNFVQKESEIMNYKHPDAANIASVLDKSGEFIVSENQDDVVLDKYTFSNAMMLSVKLGIWEASLEKYIETIEYVTEDLKKGNKIRMSREEVLRKHGELFALTHSINLSSDLLDDTPDFYWDNERLENLYCQVSSYFGISKRTHVMNEKINHCLELMELLLTHLSDKHHTRLEWMIIILIMVEVAFEIIHYIHTYVTF